MKNRMKKLLILGMALTMLFSSAMSVSATNLKDVFNARYYASRYPDLYKAYGYNEAALYKHYLTYGIKEGRVASTVIDVKYYREKYADLDKAFGDNWDAYVQHYFTFGKKEGRDAGVADMPVVAQERYPEFYAIYGPTFLGIAEQYGVVEGATDIKELVTPYYKSKGALTIKSQSEASRKNVDAYKEYASNGLNYLAFYFIAYQNANTTEEKNSFGNLYNATYPDYAKYRDELLLNGTLEDCQEWLGIYHRVAGQHGVTIGLELPETVEIVN